MPPRHQRLRIPPTTAADALDVCVPRIQANEYVDLATLDAHYLRRSDAEMFGTQQAPALRP